MVMFTGLWNPSTYINMLNEDDNDQDEQHQRPAHERQRLHPRHHGSPQASNPPTNPSNNSSINNYDNARQDNRHHHARSSSFLPRTIEYGSIFAQAVSADAADDGDKAVTWDEDMFSTNNCNGDDQNGDGGDENDDENGDDNTHDRHGQEGSSFGGGGESTGTTSSQEQALPSLTAAFQSIENRPIIINCLLYLAIYMTIAVLAYSFVLERWTVIDSLYVAVATL